MNTADLELSPREMRAMADEVVARCIDQLVADVNARGRVFITGCTTKGRFYARVCVLSFRTHQAQIDALIEDVEVSLAGRIPS